MIPTRKNSENSKSLRLQQIAEWVGGELVGDSTVTITGVAGIKEAKKGDITFLSNPKYLSHLEETQASAILTPTEVVFPKKTIVRTKNPSQAFTQIVSYFSSSKNLRPAGVHPTAVLGGRVRLGAGVYVGPTAVIEEDTVIGDRSVIEACVFIGRGCTIGSDAHIYPNVTVREETQIGSRVIIHSGTVIGSDGFGYETVNGEHVKIPQTGIVKIEDDVEIGANVCIDRGRFQETRIGKGTKIDNLVQIAHNVVIGPNCLLVSQAGISGSTELGKNVVVAGQVGIVGHIKLGDNVIVGAQSGVPKSVPDNSVVLGGPAKPIMDEKRQYVLLARLPELFKEVAELKKRLK